MLDLYRNKNKKNIMAKVLKCGNILGNNNPCNSIFFKQIWILVEYPPNLLQGERFAKVIPNDIYVCENCNQINEHYQFKLQGK